MRIGALAERTGVAQRLLRYYEEQGLLKPARSQSGYREFTDDDVLTVEWIRTLLAAGLSTATIAKVIPCMIDTDSEMTPTCPEMVSHLHREHDKIAKIITRLQSAQRRLDKLIADVPTTGRTDQRGLMA